MVQAFPQHQRMGEVIDVFRSAGEVNKFRDSVQLRNAGDLFLDEVLHRFHIVIGGAFDVLDTLCVFQAEFAHQTVQEAVGVGGKRRNLGHARVSGQFL